MTPPTLAEIVEHFDREVLWRHQKEEPAAYAAAVREAIEVLEGCLGELYIEEKLCSSCWTLNGHDANCAQNNLCSDIRRILGAKNE